MERKREFFHPMVTLKKTDNKINKNRLTDNKNNINNDKTNNSRFPLKFPNKKISNLISQPTNNPNKPEKKNQKATKN